MVIIDSFFVIQIVSYNILDMLIDDNLNLTKLQLSWGTVSLQIWWLINQSCISLKSLQPNILIAMMMTVSKIIYMKLSTIMKTKCMFSSFKLFCLLDLKKKKLCYKIQQLRGGHKKKTGFFQKNSEILRPPSPLSAIRRDPPPPLSEFF